MCSAEPNFFIIGAPKAGTTSLFDYLTQHPEVFPTSIKEPNFFANEQKYAKGFPWYLEKYFAGAEAYRLRGEATPEYLRSGAVVAPRIREHIGVEGVKLIVILRDPVDRAWSNYMHLHSYLIEELSFRQALDVEAERVEENPTTFAAYYAQGLYAAHLKEWFRHFPKEQFLFLLFEDLRQDPTGLLGHVFEFLGVDPEAEVDTGQKRNATGEPRNKLLVKAVRRSQRLVGRPFRKVVPLHLQQEIRRILNRTLIKPYTGRKPVISQELELELRKKYQTDIEELESMIERDLSSWKAE